MKCPILHRRRSRLRLASIAVAVALIAVLAATWPTSRTTGTVDQAQSVSTVRPARPDRDNAVETASVTTVAGTVIDDDAADPYVIAANDKYYAFSTNARGRNVPVWESTDLVHWNEIGDALPALPEWADTPGMVWAPSVTYSAGRFVMYITLHDERSGLQCIMTATSTTVAGPYSLTRDDPLLCSTGGSIDASPFKDSTGQVWLLWKDEPSGDEPAKIQSAPLDFSGLELAGPVTTLLSGSRADGYENVEAPTMMQTTTGYRLFFSAGDWQTSDYRTGYAACTAPDEPCDVIEASWLSSANGLDGPGGLEVFGGSDGQIYAAYHTWSSCSSCSDRPRQLNIRTVANAAEPELQ